MRLVLLKSTKFAHQAGYYLLNGRWHSIKQDKPAPKGAPVSAHPHAAGAPVKKETYAEDEWAQLKLPDANSNAGTFNKQLDQLKAAADAGDVTGILGSGFGTNTYGKKLAIIANHVLGILGSDHKVTPGQKAGTHAAVQTAPQIEAGAPAPAPKKNPEPKPAPAPKPAAEPKPAEKLADGQPGTLEIPAFEEGKQTSGVKSHYEKVAQKIISVAKSGDLSALQFMPTDKGNTWKGKTANSKKLLELYAGAINHVNGQAAPSKEVGPDGAMEVKPKPAQKPEPVQDKSPPKKADPKPEPAAEKPMKNYGWKPVELANAYSIDQLEKMMKQVEAEHYSPNGIQLYDKAGQKKLDALTWAITHIAAKEKKAAQAQPKLEEQGPKEGETKQGADGTLVFQNGRWHKQAEPEKAEKKPAATEQPKSDAASKLSQIPWDGMLLPDSNKNSKSHNGKVAHIKAMAEAGDIEGLKKFKAGVNTYGKKQNLLAQTALAALEESAPAPAAEAKPAEKPIPALPKFKTGMEMSDWADTPAFKEWKEAGITKYGSKEAWNKAPEANEFNEIFANLPWKIEPAPVEKPKDPQVTQMAALGSIPKPPKIDNFNQQHVTKIWVKMAQDGKAEELMNSISTLSKNAAKNPGSFSDKDGTALLKFANEMGGWAMNNMAPPDDADDFDEPPAKSMLDNLPKKPVFPANSTYAILADQVHEAIGDDDKYGVIKDTVEQLSMSSSADAKAVLKYAQDALDYLEDSSFLGPEEGDTKQGANGMLVFKNGRWHKQGDDKAPADKAAAEQPAPAVPADVAIPEFTAAVAKHNDLLTKAAQALKDKISAEGKAGFKGVLTNHKNGMVSVKIAGVKISKASTDSANQGLSQFAQFVDELKAAASVKAKAAAKPKPAPAAAAPAPEPEPAKQLESMDSWKQVGPQGGTNPGGKFTDADGVEWYCKFPPNEDHAKAEVLAAKLYAAAGIAGQDAKLITKDGKIGIASRWHTVNKASPAQLKKAEGALAGFAADAWLANWDVVGMEYDNLQVDEKGHALRVDAGGSLMYRAQGSKKAFGDTVSELDSLRDAKMNPQAAAVFSKMSQADITASVAKVAQIPDSTIRILVNQNAPGTKAEKKALADTLIARKNDLIAKYPKAAKVAKKRLDPTNLPVKEDRLPKAHDFANWNGPGAGLSGQAHVNDANHQVEQDMLALAKTGNLTKLKDYKFHAIDKSTGQQTGHQTPIAQHPSKHVVQLHSDLVQLLDEIANPPQPLKIFQETDVGTLDELEAVFPPKKFGTTVNAVHSNEKLGFWVVLGGAHGAAKFKPKKVMDFTSSAIIAAKQKFHEASKLAKHFVNSVQSSGSYNDLFRDGKEFDQSGNKLSDVAQAALEFATEQPEGTSVYRWQNMSDDMVKKILGAPDGSVFQATGPMCTSYSSTATSHFGKHRVTVRYAKGAKAVESFGSGNFKGEKEVTTLPNSRFVILKKEMVPNEKGNGGQRLELEVLMLPPDLGL